MTVCTISGQAAGLDAAIVAAARLLGDSGAPLIAGLGADYAGVGAAIALARRLDAAFDHMHADAVLAELAAQADGWIGATPLLAHADADTVLLIGPGAAIGPGRHVRRTVALGGAILPAEAAARGRGEGAGADPLVLSAGREDVAVTLGLLRAVLAGRPVTLAPGRRHALAQAAAVLRAARYGVAVWRAGALGARAVAQAAGLVADLNAQTRFAAVPVPPPDNAAGATLAAAALSGAPARGAFLGGQPRYEPWRPDAATLVADGEVDAALWVSALSPIRPPWLAAGAGHAGGHRKPHGAGPADLPTVALLPRGSAAVASGAAVLIEVGVPGTDHPGVLHDAALGQLAARPASPDGDPDAPSVAAVLARITEALPC